MAAPTQQELIVRQSQLQRAIEMFQLMGIQPSVREVCRLSQILTNFIFEWDEKSEEIKAFEKAMGIEHHTGLVSKKKIDDLSNAIVQELTK
jgi:hypothetical protein